MADDDRYGQQGEKLINPHPQPTARTPDRERFFEDLRDAGIEIEEIQELVDTEHTGALPVLIKHLYEADHLMFKIKILEALGRPWNRKAAKLPLLDYLRERSGQSDAADDPILFTAVGTFGRVCTAADVALLFEVANMTSLGQNRALIFVRIAKIKSARAELIPLLDAALNETRSLPGLLATDVIRALRIAKAEGFHNRVEPFTTCDNEQTRAEARKYLREIPR